MVIAMQQSSSVIISSLVFSEAGKKIAETSNETVSLFTWHFKHSNLLSTSLKTYSIMCCFG